MILPWLIAAPFLGGVAVWVLAERRVWLARWLATGALIMNCAIWAFGLPWASASSDSGLWDSFRVTWIQDLSIAFYLGVDGYSAWLGALTSVLGCFAIWLVPIPNARRPGALYALTLWAITGVTGVLLALDLFVFFAFWEIMLIPLYFMMLFFGGAHRSKAAAQFLIYTQASGLLLLVAILALFFAHSGESGLYSFSYNELMPTNLPFSAELLIAIGFTIAFAVKLAIFPVHGWMVDLFVEMPVAGLMAGIVVKVGAYGLLRFVLLPMPDVATVMQPVMFSLGLLSIVYGACLAFSQTNPKKLLAYSTISHMGLVLIGIFSKTDLAVQGVMVLLITQALSTGGLLMLIHSIEHEVGDVQLDRWSCLFASMPRRGAVMLFLIMASIGLPGLGNFIGEAMVLIGIFQVSPTVASIAACGLVLGAIYALRLMHRLFFGEAHHPIQSRDMSMPQLTGFGVVVVILIGIGLYPSPIIQTFLSKWVGGSPHISGAP